MGPISWEKNYKKWVHDPIQPEKSNRSCTWVWFIGEKTTSCGSMIQFNPRRVMVLNVVPIHWEKKFTYLFIFIKFLSFVFFLNVVESGAWRIHILLIVGYGLCRQCGSFFSLEEICSYEVSPFKKLLWGGHFLEGIWLIWGNFTFKMFEIGIGIGILKLKAKVAISYKPIFHLLRKTNFLNPLN